MYKLHLILKYLRKRRIAWIALIAVILCTFMVLLVVSIMGGWIRMFQDQYSKLSGDIIISADSSHGFPYYQEMIDRIKKEVPQVKAAVPVIRGLGLVDIKNVIRREVQVLGIPPDIGQVSGFTKSLDRMNGTKEVSFKLHPEDRNDTPAGKPLQDLSSRQGMIVGSQIVGIRRQADGTIFRPAGVYGAWVYMTVMPVPEKAIMDTPPPRDLYFIVDDSRTGNFLTDQRTVYVAFKKLQSELNMDEQPDRPALTSEIEIAVQPGVDVHVVRDQVERIVDQVADAHHFKVMRKPNGEVDYWSSRYPYQVRTWDQLYASFLNVVEHEKILVVILLAVVSLVAVFLIFCIFYMIVMEKTRDIGIIKSVGATGTGVASIFLGYGLVIGILGALAGFLSAWAFVHNINEIHEWVGKNLHIVVWNPEFYIFDKIPNTMNPVEVAIVLATVVFSSVVGALIPAISAARMNPVEALRWE